MLRNYFKTALRSLARNKTYSLINMAGLAVGIAVCMTIFVIIQYHSSFDNFHKDKDRIFRVLTEYHHADASEIFYGPGVPVPLPRSLKSEFPQIEKIATIFSSNNDQILVLDERGETVKKFKEPKGLFYTEPSFFEIFNYPLIAGSTSSLKDPNHVLLTRDIAEKYFGTSEAAMGKTIKLNGGEILQVSGILAPVPSNTDIPLKVVVSAGTGWTKNWVNNTNWDGTGWNYGCFVKLPEHTNVANFNLQLREYVKKMKSADNKDSHIIQTLSDIHFDTKIGTYSGITMSHQMINALWLIAAFIILIACVNFINLSTAQAVNRAKEVGVRKVLGSNRSQLRFQFLTETFLIVVYSLVLALIIAWLGLPAINKILSLPLSFKADNFRSIGMFVVILGVAVTVVAGFYPSLVMSRFNPIYALKSKLTDRQAKGISLRRGLVVFQFVIAQALIIGTLIILKQMNFFVKQPIGFDKNAVVNIPFPDDSASISKLPYLKKQLSSINSISDISFSSNTPIEDDNDNWTTFKFNHAIKETDFYAINKWVDNDFVKTYKLPLVAGRNLDASDTVKEFLVNEALVKKLGLKSADEAVNKDVSMWDDRLNGKIVGVVKDFYNRSFRRDLAPLIMSTMNKGYEEAGIRIATTDLSNSMKNIEKVWNQVFPDYVFEYQFLDAKVANFYKQEGQLSKLYQLFSVIAIFLSCLGLYGLASFMAVQRLKEVGIRKVLGATAMNIVYLFSKEFVVLIGIALVIASPIAWYYMNKWLQDYPSRIQISWWIFLTGGMVSVFIALATVSFQAIKAALTNPVKSLRSE